MNENKFFQWLTSHNVMISPSTHCPENDILKLLWTRLFSWFLSQLGHYWCMRNLLILYTSTLLSLMIRYKTCLFQSLRSDCLQIRISVTSFFLICNLFKIFSQSIVFLTMISTTILNNNSDRGHPCSIQDFWGNSFRFSHIESYCRYVNHM
jgi:hypothetical protein